MLKQSLLDLFADADNPVREIIMDVLILEQEYISFDRPRVRDEIDNIITRVANRNLDQLGQNEKEAS